MKLILVVLKENNKQERELVIVFLISIMTFSEKKLYFENNTTFFSVFFLSFFVSEIQMVTMFKIDVLFQLFFMANLFFDYKKIMVAKKRETEMRRNSNSQGRKEKDLEDIGRRKKVRFWIEEDRFCGNWRKWNVLEVNRISEEVIRSN